MRTVAAVVALVVCVHAGLWAISRDSISAPNFDGQLASVSYAPFEGNVNPDEGGKALSTCATAAGSAIRGRPLAELAGGL